MTDTKTSIAYIDETLTQVIVPQLRAAVRQLHDFVGQFPASTSDAPPTSTRAPLPDLCADGLPLPRVKLTKVEADAERPDEARHKLKRVFTLVPRLATEVEWLTRPTRSASIDPPSTNLEDRLRYIQWHITDAQLRRPAKSRTATLDQIVKHVNELAGICTTYRPAEQRTKFVDVCHAHHAAGMHAEVDEHNYAKPQLCRWCGDFRKMHSVNPPAKLIRLHDRGIKITTTHLRNNGIRVSA